MILFERFPQLGTSGEPLEDSYTNFNYGYFDFHICYLVITTNRFVLQRRRSLLSNWASTSASSSSVDSIEIKFTENLTKYNLENMIIKYVFPEINKIIQRQRNIEETINLFDKISIML